MSSGGALTKAELEALAGHFSVLIGIPVDRAEATDRALELHAPLGYRPADGALDRFPGARHGERVCTDRTLGRVRQNVVSLPWEGLRAADATPTRATWVLAGATCAVLAYQVLSIV